MSEIPENAVEDFKAEWHRADAEGDVGNRVARGLGAAVGEELRRLRRELEGLRAGVKRIADECAADIPQDPGNATANIVARQLRSVLVEEGRDPDAAPMSGEDVRWRPTPAAPDSADVRERLIALFHSAPYQATQYAAAALADEVLAVVGQSSGANRESFDAADAVLAERGEVL